jgi:alkylhydroperoxidase family enzyme
MKRMSSRVRVMQSPSDYPGNSDATTKKDIKELFEYVAVHYPDPEGLVITGAHGGIGVMAQNPRFAKQLLEATHQIIDDKSWGGEYVGLRELAVQVVNLHLKCDLSFQTHLTVAQAAGITIEQQAALPYWRTVAHMYSAEQLLVIEYANAVLVGDVPAELFSRVVGKYGERGAIECASAVGLWACWAMVLNATGTHFDFGYGPPSA